MRLIAALALTVLACPVAAQDEFGDAATGAALFDRHCAVCHGVAGDGDGPMAGVLMIPPSDLTTLTRRNAGVLPVIRIVMRIDGRDPLASHGSPMPVWGEFFDGSPQAVKAETGQPIMTTAPVADLLAYIASIQAD